MALNHQAEGSNPSGPINMPEMTTTGTKRHKISRVEFDEFEAYPHTDFSNYVGALTTYDFLISGKSHHSIEEAKNLMLYASRIRTGAEDQWLREKAGGLEQQLQLVIARRYEKNLEQRDNPYAREALRYALRCVYKEASSKRVSNEAQRMHEMLTLTDAA